MALTKIVNGKTLPCTPEEEAEIYAAWEKEDPKSSANIRKCKQRKVAERLQKELRKLDRQKERLVLVVQALEIILKNVTIATAADKKKMKGLREALQKSSILDNYASDLMAALEEVPETDIEGGWPLQE